MTISDYVWISLGQITLAATFALGILVGVSLATKGPRNGNGHAEADEDCDGTRRTQGVVGSTCQRRS